MGDVIPLGKRGPYKTTPTPSSGIPFPAGSAVTRTAGGPIMLSISNSSTATMCVWWDPYDPAASRTAEGLLMEEIDNRELTLLTQAAVQQPDGKWYFPWGHCRHDGFSLGDYQGEPRL